MSTTLLVQGLVTALEKTDGQSGLVALVGVPGPAGPPGSGTTDPDALHVSQRLAEFDTPTAKAAARANLELETIDGGTFF